MLEIFKCECFLLYLLLVSYVTVMGITTIYNDDFKKLVSVLDNKQKKKYEEIKTERRNHYFTGLISGIILSLISYYCLDLKRNKLCISGIVLYLTTITVYYVIPKSDYMIKYLNTEEQRMAWMDISRNFRLKKMAGYAFGFLTYLLIVFKNY